MKLITEWDGRVWLTRVALRGSYVLVDYSGMVDKYPGRVAFVKLTTSSAYVTPPRHINLNLKLRLLTKT